EPGTYEHCLVNTVDGPAFIGSGPGPLGHPGMTRRHGDAARRSQDHRLVIPRRPRARRRSQAEIVACAPCRGRAFTHIGVYAIISIIRWLYMLISTSMEVRSHSAANS